eukprot:701009-Pyramimonas_sp.AAC.2
MNGGNAHKKRLSPKQMKQKYTRGGSEDPRLQLRSGEYLTPDPPHPRRGVYRERGPVARGRKRGPVARGREVYTGRGDQSREGGRGDQSREGG